MKILLDANISWRLVNLLPDYCEQIIHVEKTDLPVPAKDIDIWEYAKSNNFIIATNDEDFLNISLSKGYPPKVILLRTGNQNTTAIAGLFKKHKKEIEGLLLKEHLGVLEIFDQS